MREFGMKIYRPRSSVSLFVGGKPASVRDLELAPRRKFDFDDYAYAGVTEITLRAQLMVPHPAHVGTEERHLGQRGLAKLIELDEPETLDVFFNGARLSGDLALREVRFGGSAFGSNVIELEASVLRPEMTEWSPLTAVAAYAKGELTMAKDVKNLVYQFVVMQTADGKASIMKVDNQEVNVVVVSFDPSQTSGDTKAKLMAGMKLATSGVTSLEGIDIIVRPFSTGL